MHRGFVFIIIILIIIFPSVLASGQEKPRLIGKIEFFGYGGLDVGSIRAKLPVREGDHFPESPDAMSATINKLKEAISQEIGKPPVDLTTVCCDARGHWIIYIGLPGTTTISYPLNPAAKGPARLPGNVLRLYEQTMEALHQAVINAAKDDESRGYSLSTDLTLRSKQLEGRAYALRQEQLLRRLRHPATLNIVPSPLTCSVTQDNPKHRSLRW